MTGSTAAGPGPGTADPHRLLAATDLRGAMRRRRMVREFEDRAVPRPLLDELVWAAGRAQQARAGVRHLVVVDDPALMRIARTVLPGYINNSPAMIVICSDLDRVAAVMGERGTAHATRLDSGAAAAHLALAAPALGLAVCTVTSWADSGVRALLDLPARIRPDVTVAVGYPIDSPTVAPGAGYGPKTHHNRFGTSWTAAEAP
jgi:nitroreductase